MKLHRYYIEKNNATPTRSINANISFYRNWLHRSDGFHSSGCTAMNSVPPSNGSFRFVGNVVKANRIWESTRNVVASLFSYYPFAIPASCSLFYTLFYLLSYLPSPFFILQIVFFSSSCPFSVFSPARLLFSFLLSYSSFLLPLPIQSSVPVFSLFRSLLHLLLLFFSLSLSSAFSSMPWFSQLWAHDTKCWCRHSD